MSPTTERPEERYFHIHVRGETAPVRIRAERICEPNADSDDAHVRLKRVGEVVGKFNQADVKGWWVEEVPSWEKPRT